MSGASHGKLDHRCGKPKHRTKWHANVAPRVMNKLLCTDLVTEPEDCGPSCHKKCHAFYLTVGSSVVGYLGYSYSRGVFSILNRSPATTAFALVSSRYQISAASHDDTTLVSYNPSSGADRDKQIVQTRILAQLSLQYPTNSSLQTQADAHMSPVTELAPENTGSTPPQATIVTSQPEARLILISPDNLSLPPQQSVFSFWPTAEQIYASMAVFQQESFKSEVTQVESSSSSLLPPQQASHLGSGTLFLCRMLPLGALLNSNK